MKRFVGLSLMAGVLFTCTAGGSGQAAPVSGAVNLAPAAQSSGIVSQVYWRRQWHHRHCRRHGYRHCWWWRNRAHRVGIV